MKSLTTVGVAALLLLAPSMSFAQMQTQTIQIGPGPGGDGMPMQFPGPGRQLKTGTGKIRGRLMTADTGAPVRRAQVRISGLDIMPKVSVTDAEGRYEFRDLPSGRFNVNASKSGFVSVSYGQTRPFEAGKAIDLGEAQVIDKADIAMPRGSAISGRILDEFGEPVADAQVTALRSAWSNGKRRLQSAGRPASTNDLGQYRIYGLPPGEYFVSATVGAGNEVFIVDRVAAATFINGSPAGPSPSGSEPRSGYAPTYFPGTSNGAEAQRIQLAVGQDMSTADFALLPVRLAKVSGTVVGSEGRPIEGAMLQAIARNSNESNPFAFSPMGSARSDRNGQFTLNNIAPGEYTLTVRGMQMITTGGGGDTMVFTTRSIGGDGSSEFGSVPLTVAGEDVSNVIVVTSKGTTVSGKVVFEGGTKPANTAPLRVSAPAIDNDGPMGMPAGSTSVTADGTFEIKGVMGPRLIRATGLPAGWILKAVTLNGTDITDTGTNIKPNEPVSGVEVVLTSKKTELNGSVTSGNRPANDYTLVVFADDPEKWTMPQTRYVRSTRPNQEGRYIVENLPPGTYYAVALEYLAQGDSNDPEVLDRLKSRATRFTIAEGEVQTLNLKLAAN